MAPVTPVILVTQVITALQAPLAMEDLLVTMAQQVMLEILVLLVIMATAEPAEVVDLRAPAEQQA